MARAYSDDLRRKLVESHAAGKGSVEELADRFGVSARWAWKVMSAYKRSGITERTPQRRHGVVPMAVQEPVLALLQLRPDMVLRELQAELATTGHRISIAQLWRVVKKLGLRLKKSRSMPPSATRKETGSAAKPSSRQSARQLGKT
jgi:transposase